MNSRPFNGLLLIDKPTGITSHDVVARVRKILRTREVGHAGTLDPLASGLLVLLLGEATKISEQVLNENKSYRLAVRFGVRTDTLDITGEILSHTTVDLPLEQIRRSANELVGEFSWPVPAFSAVKVNGQKLYQLARNSSDEPIAEDTLPVKCMKFWNLETIEVTPQSFEGHIHCSKGSYIRRWASELGEKLGCGGALEKLQRTSCEPYKLQNAVSLEQLESSAADKGPDWWTALPSAAIPLRKTLEQWRTVFVRGREERLLMNGQIPLDLDRRLIPEKRQAIRDQRTIGIKIMSADNGEIVSLLEAQPNHGLKIRRVFKSLVESRQNQ